MVTTQNKIRNPGNRPEAGVRMDNRQNWEKVCIKDVCESIIDCVNKTAPTVDYPTPFIMIRTNNIRDGRIDLSDIKYVTKEVFERWTRRILPEKGDIILTREAPLGEVGMIQTDDQIFLGQRLMQYRANPKYLDNRYLLYAFQDHVLQAQIKLLGSGATVEHMRVPDAEKLMLWLPPLRVQRAIATALSDVDALITSLDKLITKKRDIKQATMQQLLTGKTRLPEFSPEVTSAYMQTEVGILPENWKVKKLKDLCISITDGTHYTPRYVNDGIPFYSVENITANNFTDVKFISLNEHNELIRRCKPEKGDILLTRIGSLGYTKIINWDVNASFM